MARVRQFATVLVAATLALVAAVIGVLTLTVWKPADQVVASTTPDHPFVMTRDKVLPLLAKDVTVTVTAPSDQEVSLVLGTTGDVLGWIGDSPYTEVVGVESGMEKLKTVDHPATGPGGQSGDPAQSGQGAPTGDAAQSGDEAQSGTSPAGNDMWLQEATGRGTTSLTLTDVEAGRSVLAAVDGSANAPTLTLTWAVHRANAPAVVAFALTALFAVITALFLVSELRIQRHRRRRALALAERAGADVTDTQLIPLDQVRAMVEDDAAAPQTTPSQDVEPSAVALPATPGAGEDHPEDAELPEGEEPEDGADTSGDHDDHDGHDGHDGHDRHDDSTSEESAQPEDMPDATEPAVERTPLAGRHGNSDVPVDVDPPLRDSRDSGIIDVSAIRQGVAFPTRRVLREAREKGQHRVVVDGHEFDTGLIPQVAREEASQGDTPEPTRPDAGPTPASTPSGRGSSWTSLVSGWIHNGKGHDDETHS